MRAALAALALASVMAGPGRAATEAPAGAASCSGCHSAVPGVGVAIPPLFGRDPADIAASLRAFRDGTRPATIMNRLAKGFSDEEIAAIAAWIGAQPTGRPL